MAEDMDFSGLDGMDDIDWADVAADLEKNKEMIKSAATGGDSPDPGFSSEDSSDSSAVEGNPEVGLEFLMNIPLQLRVEVGNTLMLVKDLLSLNIDSVFELTKRVGDPMDIKINEKLVARGEIIIQNEKFGIKIIEILDKKHRLKTLKNA